MNFTTNKEKGNAGLSIAIAYFGSNGYLVSIPLNDTQDYDLIVDDGNTLQKVQVKASANVSDNGVYQISLKSSGGTNGSCYKRVIDTDIDLLFVLCEDMTMYLFPKSIITQRSTINCGIAQKKRKGFIDTSEYIVRF